MIKRITPENITELKENEIFVFGSNLAGRHGKGAAKIAMKWGAIYGKSNGLFGKTFAIPTVNSSITGKLPLSLIEKFVDEFISFASKNTNLIFLVTPIGCGLAGFKEEEVAPLFKKSIDLENVYLPIKFMEVLKENDM